MRKTMKYGADILKIAKGNTSTDLGSKEARGLFTDRKKEKCICAEPPIQIVKKQEKNKPSKCRYFVFLYKKTFSLTTHFIAGILTARRYR